MADELDEPLDDYLYDQEEQDEAYSQHSKSPKMEDYAPHNNTELNESGALLQHAIYLKLQVTR